MQSRLPVWIIATMAMHKTITEQVEQLRAEANQLLNEADGLSKRGELKEAEEKIRQARAKLTEADQLSGQVRKPANPTTFQQRRKAG